MPARLITKKKPHRSCVGRIAKAFSAYRRFGIQMDSKWLLFIRDLRTSLLGAEPSGVLP